MNENVDTALQAFDAYFSMLAETNHDALVASERRQKFGQLYLALSQAEQAAFRDRARQSQAFLAYLAHTNLSGRTTAGSEAQPDAAATLRSLHALVACVYRGGDSSQNPQ